MSLQPQRFIISPAIGQQGRAEHWLWEYDLSKPRNPSAADVRAHHAVKRLVGVYRSDADAQLAIAEAEAA